MELLEKEWFIKAPWGKICIVAWGNCYEKPLMLCHGERDSLASFRPLMQYLPTNYYYVGFELPGQGKSTPFPPGMPISLWDLVYCIEVVRKHFRWHQFVYMAHSFAGTVGRLYNLSHPGRLAGAIELDQITPAMAFSLDRFTEWYDRGYTTFYEKYHKLNSPKEKGPKYTWEQAIERVVKFRGLTPALARATIERFSEPAGDGLIRFTYDQRSKIFLRPHFTPEQLETLFKPIPTPTLGVVAENSIKKGLFKNTSFYLQDHGNYRVRKVCGNHDVHIVHPDRIALFVCQFLKYGIEGLDRKAKL